MDVSRTSSSRTAPVGSVGEQGSLPSLSTFVATGTQQLFAIPGTDQIDGVGRLDGAPGAPGQVVTIEDVARFLPAAAVLHAEPDGWAVVRVPANFWVDVEAVTVEVPLLGQPAQVRFTPIGYRWDYGDGTVRTTDGPGASWADLGQVELTRTPTSHDYRGRGRLDATVTVLYDAAYRVGGGAFIPVDGEVEGEAPPVPVLVVAERTALTNGQDG